MPTGRIPRRGGVDGGTKKLEVVFLGLIAVIMTGAMLTFLQSEIVPLIMAILICVFVQFLWQLVDDMVGRIVTLGLAGLICVLLANFVVATFTEEAQEIDTYKEEYAATIQTRVNDLDATMQGWMSRMQQWSLFEEDSTVVNTRTRVESASARTAESLMSGFALPRDLAGGLFDSKATSEAADAALVKRDESIIRKGLNEGMQYIPTVLTEVLAFVQSLLSSLAAALIYAAFILAEMRLFSWKIHRAFPDKGGELFTAFQKVAQGIADYFGVKTLVSFATALATYWTLSAFDVKLAFFWSVVTFFFNFIPNIGTFIAVGLIALAVIFIEPTESKLLVILILCTIHFILGNIVEPLVAGDTLDMSALAMLLSLALWYRIWGVSGALLSVPLTFAVKELCKLHPSLRFVTVFVEGQRNSDKLLKLKRRMWRFPGQYIRPYWKALVAFLGRPLLKAKEQELVDRHLFPAPILPKLGDYVALSDGSYRIFVGQAMESGEIVYRYLHCVGYGPGEIERYVYRSHQRLLLRKVGDAFEIAFAFPIFAKGEQLRYTAGAGHLETVEIESGPGYAQFGERDLPEAWQCTRYRHRGDSSTETQITVHEAIPWPLKEVRDGVEVYIVDGVLSGQKIFERRRLLNEAWEWFRLRMARMIGVVRARSQIPFPEVERLRGKLRSGEVNVSFARAPRRIFDLQPGFVYPVAGTEPATVWVHVEQVEELKVAQVTRRSLDRSGFVSVDQVAAALPGRARRVVFRYLGEEPEPPVTPEPSSAPAFSAESPWAVPPDGEATAPHES